MAATSSVPAEPSTALVIVPPFDDSAFASLQQVRAGIDPNLARWPPHVPLLWPFLDPSELLRARDTLVTKLANVAPFQVHLRSFECVEISPDVWELFLVPQTKACYWLFFFLV